MSINVHDPVQFLAAIEETKPTNIERAIALIWLESQEEDPQGLTATEIRRHIHDANCGHPTTTHIEQGLKRGHVLRRGDKFVLKTSAKQELDSRYSGILKFKPVPELNSYIGMDLFASSRDYIKRVARDLNFAYEYRLWDCVSLLARKLAEILIIEVYDHNGRLTEIQDASTNNFLGFRSLIGRVQNDFSLDGHRQEALEKIRKLGNPAAHARRFGTQKSDVDEIQAELRLVCDELLHLAGLANR